MTTDLDRPADPAAPSPRVGAADPAGTAEPVGLAMAALLRADPAHPDRFIDAARARIAALNPALGAVVHEFPPAITAERAADGPFAGTPLLLKNAGLQVRGGALSGGSRLTADGIGAADSTLVARLRAAGFALLGRTSTPELSLSFTTESALHGPCRNPWDPRRSAGGSSGGAAAAVAAGMAPLAQASDGAGSIRVPAAHCGVFGLKPSRMRLPLGPGPAEGMGGMATMGVISRSVRDAAAFLDAAAGPDAGDPYACPPGPAGGFLAALSDAPERLRIALDLRGPAGAEISAPCIAAAERGAALLRGLGHEVVEATPDWDAAAVKRAWRVVAGAVVAASVEASGAARGIDDPDALLEPVNAAWAAEGRGLGAADYMDAIAELHRAARAMGRFFARVDLHLSPVTAAPAPPLGFLAGEGMALDAFYDRFWDHAPLTAVYNASGCPAASVPMGLAPADPDAAFPIDAPLPVGVQLGAPLGGEARLLRVCAQLERAFPWADRRPPLHAASL
ncbi:amidase [Rhodovulum sp. DZ06]|uniref:amidase n=1 Tax=Rhodovulum sp. DZ06 TaxID=3425126 RepID=UPI003D338F2E